VPERVEELGDADHVAGTILARILIDGELDWFDELDGCIDEPEFDS
jgi:hypothetical protein